MKQYLAFDIGGTFIKYALMGEDGSFLESGKVPTPADTMEHLLGDLEQIGRQYAGQYDGVAVSMPGRVDHRCRHCPHRRRPDLHQGSPCGADAGAAAGQAGAGGQRRQVRRNAEAWTGALADVANGAVLVLGTGTGGAIVLNHQIWMGNTFAAGELSFLLTRYKGISQSFSENARDTLR